MDVLHTALWVDDLEAAERFYLETLGFEPDWERQGADGVDNVFVSDDSNSGLQFKTYRDPDREESLAFDHVAIGVDDVDATVVELVDVGATVLREPFVGDDDRRRAFITDPFGHELELIGPKP